MKKSRIFIILSFAFLLVAFTVYFSSWYGDDELLPEAEQWLTQFSYQQRPESKSFIKLMGIVAAPNDDEMQVGLQRLAVAKYAFKQESLEQRQPKNEIPTDYPKSKYLSLPNDLNLLNTIGITVII